VNARAILCLLAALASGCPDTTGILVEVTSSDLRVPADVDELHFQAVGADGSMADSSTLVLTGTWPYSLAIHPPSSGALPEVEITVTAQKGGEFRVRRVVRVFFDENATRRVTIDLPRSCLSVMCGRGVDCVAGMCVDGRMDAGVPGDGGFDAGLDGGDFDAGRFDAGGDDGGRPDAGSDAGSSDACVMRTEVCGGGDDDCDTLVDEGLPCPGTLVISELATGSSGGGTDEFVEIFNTTARPIDLAGVTIDYASAASMAFSNRATFAAGHVVPARGFFFAASTGYAGATAPDLPMAWMSGFAQAGGHLRLMAGAVELDRVGWGTAVAPETAAVAAVADGAGSYERKARATSTAMTMAAGGADASAGNGHDSGNNANDFVRRATREPQNAMSPAEMP
jgi:hypothetical protein